MTLGQTPQDTIQSVNKQAEELWERKPGEERGERPELNLAPQQKETINLTLKKLGFIDEIIPRSRKYDAVLVLGCRAHGMLQRLDFILQQHNAKKVVFDHLFILAGERSLGEMDRISELNIPSDLSKTQLNTEIDVARLFLQIKKDQLKDKNIKASVTETLKPEGKLRPDTEDTVRQWLADNRGERFQNLLVVSNQPHILYQEAVVRGVLSGYTIETVGPAINEELPLFDRLNALHLWLKFRPEPQPQAGIHDDSISNCLSIRATTKFTMSSTVSTP